MKKLIYLFTLLFLFTGIPEAVAWMSPAVAGGGVPSGGCIETDTFTPSVGIVDMPFGHDSALRNRATEFTATGGTVCQVDVYVIKLGTPNDIEIELYIYTDSGGSGPNALVTNGLATTTYSALNDFPSSRGWLSYTWSSSKPTLSATTTYWICLGPLNNVDTGSTDNTCAWTVGDNSGFDRYSDLDRIGTWSFNEADHTHGYKVFYE